MLMNVSCMLEMTLFPTDMMCRFHVRQLGEFCQLGRPDFSPYKFLLLLSSLTERDILEPLLILVILPLSPVSLVYFYLIFIFMNISQLKFVGQPLHLGGCGLVFPVCVFLLVLTRYT